ncbi:MAG: isoprenylcysteine carboxylmethyltransferase family protein [Vicinamibacterales bacterium]
MRASAGARVFAWMGAALFLAALAWFGWSYTVRWAIYPLDARLWPAAIHDAALFSVFALHHSVFARLRVRERLRAAAGSAVERSVYVWIASLLFLGVCWLWEPVLGVWWQVRGGAAWDGRIVQGMGVLLTIAGARAIDVLELAGLRQVEGPIRAGGMPAVFKTTGVYGLVRHPIYLGWVLMVFGEPTMTASRGVFAVVSTLYLVVAIPLEERSLAATAGPAYAEYRKAVRSRLIPFIW